MIEQKLRQTLKQYWAFDSFRPLQLEAITSALNGNDTLVLLPTGGGKSIIYQLPTLVSEGLCLVITPLISLMKDQIDALRAKGINAIAIHSGLTSRQIDIALDNCVYGDVKFLYIAPERISSESFRMRLDKMNVCFVAVDEAHCISQWGYDFRPSYLRIARIRQIKPDVPIIALTASATPNVVEDIMSKLTFSTKNIFRSTFARANISYIVRKCEDRFGQLMSVIDKVPGCGIVYVRTREGAEQLAQQLLQSGISADFYHGGMTHPMRTYKQDGWIKDECRVMVATNAFGMGIDKADVRFVVHWDICDSLEAYYQEAGRAGRDGKRSYALLLSSPDDVSRSNKRFEIEFPSPEKIKECYESLCNYLQVGIGDGKYASFLFNLFDFSRKHKLFSPMVSNAIKVLQLNGYLMLTDENENPPRIMFVVSRDDLYKVRIEQKQMDHILRIILRLYTGLFNDFVPIDEQEIAITSGYKVDYVKELLAQLWQQRVIKYIPGSLSPLLMLTEERLPTKDLHIAPESYQMRKDGAKQRLESVFKYSQNDAECRSRVIQSYFGESDIEDCGVCDICLYRRKRGTIGLEEKILATLTKGSLSVKDLVNGLDGEPKHIVKIVEDMLERGVIFVDKYGKVIINR